MLYVVDDYVVHVAACPICVLSGSMGAKEIDKCLEKLRKHKARWGVVACQQREEHGSNRLREDHDNERYDDGRYRGGRLGGDREESCRRQ